jgi:hypothetical protein
MDAMTSPVEEARQGLFRRFLSGMSYPKLFLLLVALFLVDLVVPDPFLIPFLDEAILGILAVLVGSWRRRREGSGSGSTHQQLR